MDPLNQCTLEQFWRVIDKVYEVWKDPTSPDHDSDLKRLYNKLMARELGL